MKSLNAKQFFYVVTLICILCLVCPRLAARDYVTGLKSTPKFTGIESEDSFTVNIHQGKTCDAKVYGSEEGIKKVLLRVENQTLKIKYIHPPFLGLQKDEILRVEVTMPELESLALSGSGTMTAKDKFESAKLSIALAGSGVIELSSITDNQINIELSGSGQVKLSGYTSKLDLSLAGSGIFDGEKLKTDDAEITISGSGEATAFVTKTLNATVAGSGSIYYLGKPTVNRVITGSGDIAPLKSGN